MSYAEYKMLLCNHFGYYTMTWEIWEPVQWWVSYRMADTFQSKEKNIQTPR